MSMESMEMEQQQPWGQPLMDLLFQREMMAAFEAMKLEE
jgi:hypothetical protein